MVEGERVLALLEQLIAELVRTYFSRADMIYL
jgi:hypothetical protein